MTWLLAIMFVVPVLPAEATLQPGSATVADNATEPRNLAPVEVPDLTGLSVDQAWQLVEGAGLAPGAIERTEGPTERDRVVRQSPAAGARVQAGSTVDLYLQVPASLSVPKVIGLPEAQAWSALEAAGLARGDRIERPVRAPAGTVVQQRPGPGTPVPPGTPVSLQIALTGGLAMPTLVGRREADAWALVAALELRQVDSQRLSSDEPAGTVLRQTPGPGQTVEPGTPVRLWVAEPFPVPVPDVVGRTEPEARALLEAARLVPGDARSLVSDAPAGTVVRQEPPAGTDAAPGTAVRIWIAATPQPSVLP